MSSETFCAVTYSARAASKAGRTVAIWSCGCDDRPRAAAMRTARTGSLNNGASAYNRCVAGTASKLSAAAARTSGSASRVAWIRSEMPLRPSARSAASADARTMAGCPASTASLAKASSACG